jgi:hypothetical protein
MNALSCNWNAASSSIPSSSISILSPCSIVARLSLISVTAAEMWFRFSRVRVSCRCRSRSADNRAVFVAEYVADDAHVMHPTAGVDDAVAGAARDALTFDVFEHTRNFG